MRIFITGILGYIAYHVSDALIPLGHELVGIDNLHRGSMNNAICAMYIEDVRNEKGLDKLFERFKPELVCHFAALTSVPESMEKPDEYYDVNVVGTKTLLNVMKKHDCHNLIFSSTASIYKQSKEPVKETDVLQPLNNYAKNKLEVEQIIKQNSDWLNAIIFRYFNVIGWAMHYDASKELEKTNIVPSLIKAHTLNEHFTVYGNNYPVKRENPNDHTCVRDYVDVRDIANAYSKAIDYMQTHKGQEAFNLGTKTGSSVLELIEAFNKANGVSIPIEIKEPRKGDPAIVVADNQKARELLNWSTKYSLEDSLKVLSNIVA